VRRGKYNTVGFLVGIFMRLGETTKSVVLILIVAGLVAGMAGGCKEKTSGTQKPQFMPYEALADERGNTVKATIHYLPLTTITEFPSDSENTFVSRVSYIEGGIHFVLNANIIALLNDFPFEREPTGSYSPWYSCSLYTSDNKLFRVSLAGTDPVVVLVNGQPYKATPKVVEGFIRLLPVVDYTRAHDELEKAGFWGKGS
jgi:hypothetical protein